MVAKVTTVTAEECARKLSALNGLFLSTRTQKIHSRCTHNYLVCRYYLPPSKLYGEDFMLNMEHMVTRGVAFGQNYYADQEINNSAANITDLFIFIEQFRCKRIVLSQIAGSIIFLCFLISGQFKAI